MRTRTRPAPPRTRPYGNHILSERSILASELLRFRTAGGGAIVDLTIRGIKPDPSGLREISATSGVHIVAGTGYDIDAFAGQPIASEPSTNSQWIWSTMQWRGSKAPTSALASSARSASATRGPREQRVMRAAVIAQRETGLSINVHPGRDPSSPVAVAKFVRAAGGDTTRLVLSHMDRTLFREDDLARRMDHG